MGLSIGLAACAPTEFGMPAAQFNQLSNAQKQQVIEGYNQRQEQEAQVEPLIDALGAVGQAADLHKSVELSHSHHSSMTPWSCSNGSCSRSGSSSDSGMTVGVGLND